MTKLTKLKLLLAGASCAVIAACSPGTSISSPGEENQVPPPPPGGGGGGGTSSITLLPQQGCPSGTSVATNTYNVQGNSVDVTACRLTTTVLQDTTLTSDGVYFLDGPVFVGQDAGASSTSANGNAGGTQGAPGSPTLTIPAGATIVGATGGDYIVVSRGASIDARGTATNPIVFTSAEDELASRIGTPRSGNTTDRGEWGGLVINGRAPINACIDGDAVGGTEDCQKSGEGSSGLFGGAIADDNSGFLQYVQVKYAGFRVNNEDELNGIALQGVGSDTTLSHLQVHNNEDDGIEFFGGTANAKYLVLTGNADDSLDYTDGWTGNVQYVVVRHAADDGDQGFEFDNNGDENDALPRSNPTIFNFTLQGVRTSANSDTGMLLREGTAGYLANGIVFDFGENCLDVDQDATFAQVSSGDLELASIFFDCAADFATDDDGFDEEAFFFSQPNTVAGDNSMSGLFAGANEQAVPVTAPPNNGFFDDVSYIGAFPYDANESSNWAQGWTFGLFPEPQCPAGTSATGEVISQKRVCRLTGTVTSDLRLSGGSSLVYELSGPVFVGEDTGAADGGDPAVLTIDAGVTVIGSSGSDYLVVSRGSELRSNGTATAPVVMTSRSDFAGTNQSPNDDRGQWGGLVLNGFAPINACIDGSAVGGSADCEKSGEGSSGLFGGDQADDSSGSIAYTRVQYAGFRVNAEDELNGIAFQGTGSGTEVNFVQVHNNEDDGIEFFGGTTNAKHLVLTGIGDDSLDYTDGWTGSVQFVIVQHAADDGDQGFEFDNNGDENSAPPRSNPTIANFTLIGVRGSSASDTGMLLREGTAGTFVNGIVVDFNQDCLDVDNTETFAQATAGDLVLASTFFDCPTPFSGDSDGFSEEDFFNGVAPYTANTDNTTGTTSLAGFSFVTDFSAIEDGDGVVQTPNNATGVVPSANGPESQVPVFDVTQFGSFFTEVDYIGAVEDANDTWYQGWTLQQAQ
ncbi:MAG: hypothetical protein ACFE0P_13060 [Oceanicaulis sp.]